MKLTADVWAAETTACIAQAQSSREVGISVKRLIGELATVNMRLHHPYELSGMGSDEWGETKEALHSLVDSYIGDEGSTDGNDQEER